MPKQSTVYFYGGAGSVTGSNFLLDVGAKKFLIDCGLFQGKISFEKNNWAPFPFDPKDISILINTHAHIDHLGRIPKLVRDGFRGKILSTEATKALAQPLLQDAMELLLHDAQKHGLEPLYGEEDIAQALRQWEGIPYHAAQDLGEGVSLELLDAGHILGSAMAKFSRDKKVIVFTGDLGGGNSPILPTAEIPQGANYLVMESVYGDRMRPDDENRRDMLEDIIEDTAARGGALLIPAFSMERTQDLIFEIRALMLERRVPSIPVYMDSPLAQKVTDAYLAHPQYFSEEIQARIKAGERIFSFPELHFVHDAEQSKHLRTVKPPYIILAGSGMSNGGRILSHEKDVLPDEKSTLLIVGYQAAGSLGRRLTEGAKTVNIHGEDVPVRCAVKAMYGYSAHMDSEQLLEFVNKTGDSLAEVFVVMGEPASSGFLAQRIRDYLGIKAVAPDAAEKAQIAL